MLFFYKGGQLFFSCSKFLARLAGFNKDSLPPYGGVQGCFTYMIITVFLSLKDSNLFAGKPRWDLAAKTSYLLTHLHQCKQLFALKLGNNLIYIKRKKENFCTVCDICNFSCFRL
jgi:hypothetical protein